MRGGKKEEKNCIIRILGLQGGLFYALATAMNWPLSSCIRKIEIRRFCRGLAEPSLL